MANDPYWNNVVLAMHMDDVGLSDLKGHAVTLKGDAARSAVKSMFGGYSACFDGSGDYLTVANSSDYDLFGASTNSTIEFFAWFGSTANTPHVLIVGTSEAYRATLFLRSGILVLWTKTNNTNHGDRITGPSIATGRWYHIAVCNAAGILKLFVDGVSYGTSNTTVVPTGALGVALGWQQFGGVAGDYLNGYIDDLRITKGVARYTDDFTVPTEAFPNTPPQLLGTVMDMNSNLVARTVRSYRRSDGMLAGTAVSSGVDGTFSVNAYDGSAHYVVCLDDGTPDENALIFDNITPV